MSRLPSLFISAVVLAIATLLDAQETSGGNAPTFPAVSRTPDYSAWTVTFSYPEGTDTPPVSSSVSTAPTLPRVKEIHVTKMEKTRREVSVWSDGQITERWYVEKYELWEQPHMKDIYILNADHFSSVGPVVSDFSKSDFPELNWLSANSFIGEEDLRGEKCWHFQLKTQPKSNKVFPKNASAKEAWINKKTKLPQGSSEESIIRTYAFTAGEIDRPVLPERFAKALKEYQKRDIPSR